MMAVFSFICCSKKDVSKCQFCVIMFHKRGNHSKRVQTLYQLLNHCDMSFVFAQFYIVK